MLTAELLIQTEVVVCSFISTEQSFGGNRYPNVVYVALGQTCISSGLS